MNAKQDLAMKMLSARTAEEIAEAKTAASAWLVDHPDDLLVRAAGEQLQLMASVLEIVENMRSSPAAEDDREPYSKEREE